MLGLVLAVDVDPPVTATQQPNCCVCHLTVGELVGDKVQEQGDTVLCQVLQLERFVVHQDIPVRIYIEILSRRSTLSTFNNGYSDNKVIIRLFGSVKCINRYNLCPTGYVGELDLYRLGHDDTATGSGAVRHGQLHAEHLPVQRGHDQLGGEGLVLGDGRHRVGVALEI